jgi:hypothetical protein
MAVYYKVWIEIEKIDEKKGIYEDAGLPDHIGKFRSLTKAQAFVMNLLRVFASPATIATSDHRPRTKE